MIRKSGIRFSEKIMLKQKARAVCRSNHNSSRSSRRICAMPAALRAHTPAGASERVGGAEIARVGSASAVLIDLLDERRTQGRPRRWASARAHCQIESQIEQMGRATHCTASPLELIPDKDIAQSRSHCPRLAKDSGEGVLPADVSAPAHEFIMNEFPGIGTTAAGVDVFSTSGIIVAIRSADCGLFWRVRKCRKPACRSRICGAFC